MNKLIITVILFVTLVFPALAQDTAKPEATAEVTSEATVSNSDNPLYCEGAQEWYDEATVDIQDLVSTGLFFIHQTPSKLTLQSDYNRFRESHRALRDLEYPDCVSWARNRLLSAYREILEGLEIIDSGKTGEEIVSIGVGIMIVGQVDGYMMARGVETIYTPSDQ